MGRRKRNQHEVEEFMLQDTKAVLDNHFGYSQYIKYCKTTHNLSDDYCKDVWIKIWAEIKERFRLEKDKLISKHLERYWVIYQEAMEMGDLNTARNTLNDISKLQGLAEPDKLEINQDTIIRFKFGDEPVENNNSEE